MKPGTLVMIKNDDVFAYTPYDVRSFFMRQKGEVGIFLGDEPDAEEQRFKLSATYHLVLLSEGILALHHADIEEVT